MEQTFMTIHALDPDATILFASESIADILGYQPAEVQGKSCFDYFHPHEVPFARSVHSRGVLLDKAAVLHYARILSRDGRWVGCECCFTIVHDVLVACTSIYRRNAKSERRAIEAPQIRRIFSCSPRDPRYHMLEHLSPKFKMPPMEREPRAALILNRFTRSLNVMFATTSISAVIGLRPDEIRNRSFYCCIQESCLPEAIKCLESAKANDSIAYLRFSFQDPREDEELSDAMDEDDDDDDDEEDGDGEGPDDEDEVMTEAGAERTDTEAAAAAPARRSTPSPCLPQIKLEDDDDSKNLSLPAVPRLPDAASSSSSSSSAAAGPSPAPPSPSPSSARAGRLPSIELEAVVSCTSDGLVVILRKARPPIPPAHPPLVAFDYGDGLFAAPWAQHPIRPHFPYESLHTFRPPLLPQYMPLRDNVKDAGGPPLDVLMGSIRDVAVFAWGLVGINPAMAAYGRGLPSGEARPSNSAAVAGGSGSRSSSSRSSSSSSSSPNEQGNAASFSPSSSSSEAPAAAAAAATASMQMGAYEFPPRSAPTTITTATATATTGHGLYRPAASADALGGRMPCSNSGGGGNGTGNGSIRSSNPSPVWARPPQWDAHDHHQQPAGGASLPSSSVPLSQPLYEPLLPPNQSRHAPPALLPQQQQHHRPLDAQGTARAAAACLPLPGTRCRQLPAMMASEGGCQRPAHGLPGVPSAHAGTTGSVHGSAYRWR